MFHVYTEIREILSQTRMEKDEHMKMKKMEIEKKEEKQWWEEREERGDQRKAET